jgi:hypothetical protein
MKYATVRNSSILLMTLLLMPLAPVVFAAEQSQVRVEVTDAFGHALSTAKVRISGKDLTIDVEPGRIVRLPFGRYQLDVTVPGFAPNDLLVVIDQPLQIVNVGMRLGKLEVSPRPCAIKGSVISDDKAVRVRVVQLFGSYVADVPLSNENRFDIPNLECGDYLLMAFGTGRLIGTLPATASVKQTVVEMKFSHNE